MVKNHKASVRRTVKITKKIDRKYDEEKCWWGLSPDTLLVENIKEIPVGKALDLGPSEGRNAEFGGMVTGSTRRSNVNEMFRWMKSKGVKFVEHPIAAKNKLGRIAWKKRGFEDFIIFTKRKL